MRRRTPRKRTATCRNIVCAGPIFGNDGERARLGLCPSCAAAGALGLSAGAFLATVVGVLVGVVKWAVG